MAKNTDIQTNKRQRDDRHIANQSSLQHTPIDDFLAQVKQRKKAEKEDKEAEKVCFDFSSSVRSAKLENGSVRFQPVNFHFGSIDQSNTMRQYTFNFSTVPQVWNYRSNKP